jgi:hypothetical protein
MMHRFDLRALRIHFGLKQVSPDDVISQDEPSGIARRDQNCSLRKTLFLKMNGSNSDRGHRNSNTGLFVPTMTADAVTA